MVIGIISDTHNLLREEALAKLFGCNLIIHAGDIGNLDIIRRLEQITEVEFVKGNCDEKLSNTLKEELIIDIDKLKILIIHDINKIRRDLSQEDINIVVCGHSHKMNIFEKNGIIYINPGSIGRKRFKLPITMAKLYIEEDTNGIDSNVEKYVINDTTIYIESIELEC